jgi:hypothetical protein
MTVEVVMRSLRASTNIVWAGFMPATHTQSSARSVWVAGTSPAMTMWGEKNALTAPSRTVMEVSKDEMPPAPNEKGGSCDPPFPICFRLWAYQPPRSMTARRF